MEKEIFLTEGKKVDTKYRGFTIMTDQSAQKGIAVNLTTLRHHRL